RVNDVPGSLGGWAVGAGGIGGAGSARAGGAVEGRSSSDDAGPARPATPPAGLAGAIVDLVPPLVGARALEAVPVVRDRRSAAGDGGPEDRSRGGRQPRAFRPREPARAPERPYPRPAEDLIHVDVAHARDLTLVHQPRLHGA